MNNTIYTINTASYLLYPVTKNFLNLTDMDSYQIINNEHLKLIQRLSMKNIKYDSLKRALIPNQDKDNKEICFVFDTLKINSDTYGFDIFNKLIPLLDKNESTYSILAGDYVDILKDVSNSQIILKDILEETITKFHSSIYQYSGQYFFVYVNNIAKKHIQMIIQGFKNFDGFYGYTDINLHSRFKTYLSEILSHVCIKNKKNIIASHPSDYEDHNNINMLGYPFEKNGFKFVSINEDSFGPFLSYKIESILPNKDDVGFSFNALFPKFDSIEKLKVTIDDNRWYNHLLSDNSKHGKLKILETLDIDIDNISKNEFAEMIFNQICGEYIYNLRKNEYENNYLFNVCIELLTKKKRRRKTTVALIYKPDCGEIEIETIT